MKKLLAIITAASMAVSALPFTAIAYEPSDDLLETIISAEDESFETAAETAYDEPQDEFDYSDIDLFDVTTVTGDGTDFVFNEGYDMLNGKNKDFNGSDGNSADTSPDGTKYLDATAEETAVWDGINFDTNKDFYVSVDFKYADAGAVMTMRNKLTGGNIGPSFRYKTDSSGKGVLYNERNGQDTLYTGFKLKTWYKMALEGKMKTSGGYTTFTLYEYDSDGNMTKVAPNEGDDPIKLNLRNFATSNVCKYLVADTAGISFDNEFAVQTAPNALTISQAEEAASIDAGSSMFFTVEASRNNVTENVTQPDIVWSLEGLSETNKEAITIESTSALESRLTVSALAEAQSEPIKVVATGQSSGNPRDVYEIALNAKDLSAEPFHVVQLSGDSAVTAGTTTQYTFSASMQDGTPVTALSDDQYVWTIYDVTGGRALGNKFISISKDGKLTVDKSVVGQKIRLGIASPSGVVNDSMEITINNAPATETLLHYNACEETVDPGYASLETERKSWDGSAYYIAGEGNGYESDFIGRGDLGTTTTSGDILVSIDIKFPADGTGFKTCRNDGGLGMYLCRHDFKDRDGNVTRSTLCFQTGSSSYSDTEYALDPDKWYHIDLMYNTGGSSVKIDEYADGALSGEAKIYGSDKVIIRGGSTNSEGVRSLYGFNRIKINKGTAIDNYRLYYPKPTELEITDSKGNAIEAEPFTVQAGIPASFSVKGTRGGLPLALRATSVDWAVCETEEDIPVEGDDFTITGGVLSSYALVKPQTVRVRARGGDASAYLTVSVVSAPKQFEITNVGFDGGQENAERGTVSGKNEDRLVRLYVNKLGDYKEDVLFIMTFYNEDGKLVGTYTKKTSGKSLKTGENEVPIDYTLPADYDKETGTAKVMAWTALTTREEPDGASGEFAAAYETGSVTLRNMPEVTGKTTIAIYTDGTKDSELSGDVSSKVVYIAQSEAAVSDIQTELEAGTYIIAVGGQVDGEYTVHRAEFTVAAAE